MTHSTSRASKARSKTTSANRTIPFWPTSMLGALDTPIAFVPKGGAK